ncbi:MAG: tetratricopeptide repeat protein [Planctomycetota bacterium]
MFGKYRNFMVGVVLSCLAVWAAGCGGGSEKATVAIEYMLNPSKGLPPGMNSVAVLDAKVNEVTDTKWSEMAANYVQHLIQEANDKYGAQVQVADRKHTSSVMKEQDMAAAGMVESPKAGAVAKQLGVQGLIMTEINVKVETHKGKGRTVSAMDMFGGGGHGWGAGGGGVQTTEAETVSRNITVQTDFKLVDAANQKNWDTQTRTYRESDKTKVSPFFGSSKTEAALTPRDEIIGAAVETGAREFVSKLVPCAVRYEVEVTSSGQENCVRGVKLLRGDMYAEALSEFKAALVAKPEDDRAAFAAGVCCEAMGNFEQALSYYKQAMVSKDREEYQDAKKRISENIERIRKVK